MNMQKVFEKYNEFLTERCNKIKLLNLGEDSIRYDFFIALSEIENIRPSDIQLEYSIHESSYTKRANKDSKRKEKPQIDMIVDTDNHKLNFEFGLFRQNSNEKGSINKTARTVKMLKDMIRLALDSYYTKRESFFICVADDKMLKHQLKTEIIGEFPSDYIINRKLIEKQMESKTNNFDSRFLDVFNKLNIEINCKIIYEEKIEAKLINRETKIISWEIKI